MKKLLYFFVLSCLLLAVGCARMGSPDGGWYDDDPPRVVSSTPADQATDVTTQKITILFDEYIKLADPSQNVIVSPPQLEMPEIQAKGKKIVVELKDSLKPNTTYTIDFSDAISDNNEENPMGNFTYTFSTGEHIDTFEVAGYVLNASNLEPVKGISVGLYNNLADSVFRKEPLMRISRTDGTGRFVIKGVAPGEYRVYALQDADNDFKFTQKSEMIAFSHQTYKPYSKPDIRQDTIWRDTLHIDNILQVPYTHFFPDDVIMMAFQEVQTDRYLLKQPDRTDADRIKLFFSYGHEQLPVIKGLNFDADSAFVVEYNEKKDSLIYWLRDTTLINQDTLALSMEYMMTDSMGVLVSQTDTVEVIAKTSYAKRQKEKQKEYEKWEKEQEKKKKREEPYDSIYPITPLELKFNIPASINPTSKIRLEIPTPLEKADSSAVHLYSKVDSLWYRVPFVFRQLDAVMRQFEIVAEWQPETEYSLEIDSAAFVDIYGLASEAVKKGIKSKSLDEFASLVFRLSGVRDTGIVVQLLSREDKCLRQIRTGPDREAAFFYLDPGKFYARAFVDRNGNNLWDTGNYDEDLQPEDIYYFSSEIECKAKWDITKEWDLIAKPRNLQKPGALIKQKDNKEKKKKQNRNAERARKLGIEYIKQQAVKQEKVEK